MFDGSKGHQKEDPPCWGVPEQRPTYVLHSLRQATRLTGATQSRKFEPLRPIPIARPFFPAGCYGSREKKLVNSLFPVVQCHPWFRPCLVGSSRNKRSFSNKALPCARAHVLEPSADRSSNHACGSATAHDLKTFGSLAEFMDLGLDHFGWQICVGLVLANPNPNPKHESGFPGQKRG